MNNTTPDTQPCRKQNIDAITLLYENGIKAAGNCKVGIELEHTLVHDGSFEPVTYTGEDGVERLLETLKADYPRTTFDGDDLIGLSRLKDGVMEAITLEPAAQVELSAGPYVHLSDADSCFRSFETTLQNALSPLNEHIVLQGYHPTMKVEDLVLIPKRRYKFMNLYLGEISPWGPRMMRGTASTQVSIDYTSPEDCIRKLRLSTAAGPILALITDNTPFFEGAVRPHPLMRMEIWEHCDPDRCGPVPGVMNDGFTWEDYAEYILDTPAILSPCAKNGWCYSEKTFGELYAERPMEKSDVEHAISMTFNDTRLKTYVEIRPADAMPIDYVIAYAALIKGLFCNADSLDALDELLASISENDIHQAKQALMNDAYKAQVYGRPVAELADALIDIARTGLPSDEHSFLKPLADLVAKRTTLADIALS